MSTVKKVVAKAAWFLVFLLAARVGVAQEQPVKVADATELVSAADAGSTAKDVKPVIVVPGKLAKAIGSAKTANGKFQTLYWYERTGPNTYVLIGSGPTTAPTGLCPLTTGSILCAVGFSTAQTGLTDAIANASSNKRFKDPD